MEKSTEQKLSRATRIKLAMYFLLIFFVLTGIFAFFESRIYYERRENKVYLAANQARLIEESLDSVMTRAYTLRSLLLSHGGTTDFFETAAEELYAETEEDTGLYVKNLILAPDGIVQYVYPMEGNEAIVGLDYMDESQAGNEEAVEAYEENKLVVTEPFNLKQGGQGIAGRLPVYLTNEDGEKEFWGMVSVTLDMAYLLEQFNLEYLEESGSSYCLWYTNKEGEKIILASSEKQPKNPVSYELNSSSIQWTLDIAPTSGWLSMRELGAGMLLILVISLLVLRSLESRARIRGINETLQNLAITDELTGCYSRYYVATNLLEPATEEWQDVASCYSLALIDVDYFKQVNDTYGHDAGDRALVAIAHILRKSCDEFLGDCVIRYGGDEFIVVMKNIDRDLFTERMNSILEQVRAVRIAGAQDCRLSVSIGAALGDSRQTYYELFAKADEQAYLSKENGRDQCHLVVL